MSKIDRQIDEFSGEKTVVLKIEHGEVIDVGALHQMIRNEIDQHQYRIPLDLRGVHGVPQELIEVIRGAQRYAISQGKQLSISHASVDMQDALNPRSRRNKKTKAADAKAPGDVARSLLNRDEKKDYDISKAEKVVRRRPKHSQRSWKHWTKIVSIVVGAVAIIGAVEWYIIFSDTQSDLILPTKTFENTR